MNPDFFYSPAFLSSNALIPLQLLKRFQIVLEILFCPPFLSFKRYKNLKVTVTSEKLIAQYLMLNNLFIQFLSQFINIFFELANCFISGDIRSSRF